MKGISLSPFCRRWIPRSLVLAIVMLALAPTSQVMADSVVTFPDPNLDAVIREAIGKPTGDIYESDLNTLSEFNASNRGIVDLTGIEHCVNLGHVVLRSNQISDLSPLSGLLDLHELDLGLNNVSDPSPLLSLSLSWLWLDHNKISNLALVPGTSDILDLGYNQIRSLAGFSGRTDTMGLSHNQINDLSGFSGSAQILDLSHNQVSDIRPLTEAPFTNALSTVYLRANPLSSTSRNTYIPALEANNVKVYWDVPANQYPDRPVNASPTNAAAGTSLTPTLSASAFSDPDGDGDTHAASRWQVRGATGGYNSPIWDSGSSTPAISIAVPEGKLRNGTTYYWRVGYKDSGGLWSSYSKETAFTTAPAPVLSSPPAIVTVAANSTSSTSATLNLHLSSLGSATSVQVSFEWGQGTAYGSITTPQAMTSTGHFSYSLSGLAPATAYYFRAKAVGDGASYGGDMAFTTNAAPAVIPPVVPDDDIGTGDDGQVVEKPAVPEIPDTDSDSAPPTITSLVSNIGRPGQELTMTITGANLTGATAVSLGAGIVISAFTVASDTEITARIAIGSAAEAGPRDVTMVTPHGTITATGAFTVEGAESKSHLWVYPAAAVGGLAGLGMLASLGIWLARRQTGNS